jgi:hypothetical protein
MLDSIWLFTYMSYNHSLTLAGNLNYLKKINKMGIRSLMLTLKL